MNGPTETGDTNGATAPGAGMAPARGVLVIIGISFAALVGLAFVTRKSPRAKVSASVTA